MLSAAPVASVPAPVIMDASWLMRDRDFSDAGSWEL